MTRRGFWFLAVAAGSLAVAIALPAQFSVALAALSALLWYGIQWTLFRLRADYVARQLVIERTVVGTPLPQATLWQNRPITIVTHIRSPSRIPMPRVRVQESLPAGIDAQGSWSALSRLDREHEIELKFGIRPQTPGHLRFEGVLLEISDPAAFFTLRHFVRHLDRATVLPALAAEVKNRPSHKRTNLIPAHGLHRHLRPGSGSELFNLRDYVIGDPPKRIAWKVSARRDQLTTKEYESEVPVRATILLDHSDSVRIGWPEQTALSQSVEIAAALTRRLIDQRDPVGLCLIDEDSTHILPPACGPRQQTRILTDLCKVAAEPPKPTSCPADMLVEPALRGCAWLYPELLEAKINRRYFWQEWGNGRWLGWPAWVALGLVTPAAIYLLRDPRPLFVGFVLAGILVGLHLLRAREEKRKWHPRYRRPTRKNLRARKQVASVVAAVEKLGPAGLALAVDDDAYFARKVQEFFIEHRLPYPRPLHDAHGHYLFESTAKIDRAARVLLRAVAHARENEVFILLIDLLEHERAWQPLLDALKVASSRHHEVILVTPWPAELDVPRLQTTLPAAPPHHAKVESHFESLVDRYFHAYATAKHELGRLGIPFVPARLPDTVEDVLRRIEVVRAARIPAHR